MNEFETQETANSAVGLVKAFFAAKESHASAPTISSKVSKPICAAEFERPLAHCALRMVRLLDLPNAMPMLYPEIMRVVCYRLLTGPQGAKWST